MGGGMTLARKKLMAAASKLAEKMGVSLPTPEKLEGEDALAAYIELFGSYFCVLMVCAPPRRMQAIVTLLAA